MNKPVYKLVDWVLCNKRKLDLEALSENPLSINFLQRYPSFINWHYLSANKNAVEILLSNKKKISFNYIGKNENPIIMKEIIEPNIKNKHILGNQLSANINAIPILRKNPTFIYN